GSSIHRADAAPATAARPAAVAALLAAQEVERALAILAPGDGVAAARFGKQFTPALFAQHVHALRPVVLGVLIVPHAAAPQGAQVRVAVFEPALHQRGIVFAGVEGAGDCRGRERGTFAAAGDRIGNAAARA